MKKFSVPTLVLIYVVISCAFIEIADAISAAPISSPTSSPIQAPPGVPGFCVGKCAYRCSRNPRELCKKLCMHCCKQCNCVPNGPFADKAQCPCYRDIKNDEGKSKCP